LFEYHCSLQREEILIGRLGLGGVALQDVGAGEAKTRECAGAKIKDNATMVEDLLILSRSLLSLMQRQVGFAAHVDGIEGPKLEGRRGA
jgi:hypothetical protein